MSLVRARFASMGIAAMKIIHLGPLKSAASTDYEPLCAGELSALDHDVLTALLNLGCARESADAALSKAKAAGGPNEFEPLFRRALEMVR
jgi:hypothetical protein